ADVLIKGRASKGNVATKYPVKRVELKEKGVSTLKPRKIWFDDVVRRLNVDGRGDLLGEFRGDDMLLVVTQKGVAKTLIPDLSTHFDEDMILLEKWNPEKPLSAVYYEGEKEKYYIKRFVIESEGKEELFISEHPKSVLELISTDWRPVVEVEFNKPRGKDAKPNQTIDLEDFIAVKGIKALGNVLTSEKVKSVNAMEPLPFEEPEEQKPEDMEVVDEESLDSSSDTTKSSPKSKGSNPEDEGQTLLF
ncbi:MAG: DNA gyrase/topoisomerase IV subunit A, partial [Flavobacteriales bacterium]